MKKEKNIYAVIEEKSNYLFDKYNLSRYITNQDNKSNIENILRQKLYELNLNICNQVIYDYTYTFKLEDFEFIEKFNLYKIIEEMIQITYKDLIKIKKNRSNI